MDFQTIDGKFLEADTLIGERKFDAALALLNELITENPSYGKAHNHLGWIYEAKLNDYESAEMHYKLALKNSPAYHPAYYNYAILLSNEERFEELIDLLNKALQIKGIDKAKIHQEFAIMYEKQCKFDQAIKSYKEYIKYNLATPSIEKAKDSIERCKNKKEIIG